MGGYWKKASKEQQQKFVETFKSSFVETFAKGMANYADLDIKIEPADGEVPQYGKASVLQTVKGPSGVNRILYTMGRRKGGDWKLINVVLDGVNLGQTFRSQFAQAVKSNDGSIDAAINGWSAK